jgi:Zn finger protein HypA/HybF involved in hydrogenase expression
MKFRLKVHKMKCTNCDTIILVEQANFSCLKFICPSCESRLEHMEDITVVQEGGVVINNG